MYVLCGQHSVVYDNRFRIKICSLEKNVFNIQFYEIVKLIKGHIFTQICVLNFQLNISCNRFFTVKNLLLRKILIHEYFYLQCKIVLL